MLVALLVAGPITDKIDAIYFYCKRGYNLYPRLQ